MKRTLFLLAVSVASAASLALAAVGDVYEIGDTSPYFLDGIVDTSPTKDIVTSVDRELSTRFYDSNKGGPWTTPYSDGTEGDSLMCWSHAASNSIQYWQDIYGVFYKDRGNMAATGNSTPRTLPNGYYPSEKEYYYGVYVSNERHLNIAQDFYKNWSNAGGKFSAAADWYFKWDSTTSEKPGGYYSEYFGNGNDARSAYVTVYSQHIEDMDPGVTNTSAGYSAFANNDINGLKEALLPGFGLEKQADGSYVQKREGMLPFIGIWYDTTGSDGETLSYGHMISAYGYKLDASGNLKSIIIGNGDDGISQIQEIYLKVNAAGKIQIYRDEDCSTLWLAGKNYYIGEVSYINTPEVLNNMLAEYRSPNEAQVWNGKSSTWEQQNSTTDELPTEATGWDVHVNGSNIATEHHGYYHTYATDGRAVLFDDHAAADKRSITINGTVSASSIEVAAEGYTFKAGENAVLAAGADMVIRQEASLHSEVELTLGALTLENGALLSSTEAIATERFLATLKEGSSFSLSNDEALAATIKADLDLSVAKQVIVEITVNLNGHDLKLAAGQDITLAHIDGTAPIFTGIDSLIIGENEVAAGTEVSLLLDFVPLEGEPYSDIIFIYDGNSIWAIVPEPTTATLSLMALAALTTRRRRK